MHTPPPESITQLLSRFQSGEEEARDALLEALYGDLRKRAQQAMVGQPRDHTLQPTALVHEAYVKLIASKNQPWASRQHFMAVAALAMRQILVDHARRRNAGNRCAVREHLPLDSISISYDERAYDLEKLHLALEKLATFDSPMARVVELRFFAGASMEEAARIVELKQRTVERRWSATRAWLLAEIGRLT